MTLRNPERPPARDVVRAALRTVLVDHGLSQSALARELTNAASEHGLRRGDSERDLRYDPAMVNRWLDGKLMLSRQAAWLLDLLYPRSPRDETFQDIRDRYVLETDRDQAPDPLAVRIRPILEGARCAAEVAAHDQRRRSIRLGPDEWMTIILLSVVDCDESRHIIKELLSPLADVRVIALYDLLGHWDLAVLLACPSGYDVDELQESISSALIENGMAGDPGSPSVDVSEFTRHRTMVTDLARMRGPNGVDEPRFLVLESSEEYDLLRVQKAFLFIELRTLPDMRRTIAKQQIVELVRGSDIPSACRDVVEAVIAADDCLIIEIAMTCANGQRRLNQLNRVVGRELTRFKAQKYNLLVYTVDESGWGVGDN